MEEKISPLRPMADRRESGSAGLRCRWQTVSLAAAFAVWWQAPVPAARAAETPWLAGVASVKITPAEPVLMYGYSGRDKPHQGAAGDLFAKALALRDPAGARAVLITCGPGLGAIHSLTLMATGRGRGGSMGGGSRERERADPGSARSIRSRSWLKRTNPRGAALCPRR